MLYHTTGRSFTGFLLLNVVLNMVCSLSASLVADHHHHPPAESSGGSKANASTGQNPVVVMSDRTLPAMMGVAKRHHHHHHHIMEMLKALESRFLQKLGLKSRPKPKRDFYISQHMIELYDQRTHSDRVGDDAPQLDVQLLRHKRGISLMGDANTIRSHNPHDAGDDDKNDGADHDHSNWDGNGRTTIADPNRVYLRFNVSVPQTEQLKGAELRLFRQSILKHIKQQQQSSSSTRDKSSQHMFQRIRIEDILRTGEDPILIPIDTHVVDVRQTEWISFDVLPAVHRWIHNPSNNYGLYVTITSLNGSKSPHEHVRLKRSAHKSVINNNNNNSDFWPRIAPHLLTYSYDESELNDSDVHRRRQRNAKRSAKRRHRGKGKKDNCRRHSLYVDFSDVGWNDWIVAPPGYHAYYCSGECPLPLSDHLNSTNHAIVQTLVNSVNPQLVPKACCIPTELSPISMLYVDEYDKVVLKNYQDMVVEGCGCR